jgi:hypothetical protein
MVCLKEKPDKENHYRENNPQKNQHQAANAGKDSGAFNFFPGKAFSGSAQAANKEKEKYQDAQNKPY